MSNFNDRLRESLGHAFTIERELGGGGMSRVFLAQETALNRRVVVKVLAPELAEGLSSERFAREIAMAATLQDPHIVPVLTAGGGDMLPWYTMPFIEGESLRARLAEGVLPRADALRILREVAMALEYAHGRGVIHRDIKPENILLAGRTAVVTDFGIAKAVSAARTATRAPADGRSAAALTRAGQSLGTPAYMAPEQAAGDHVDHRADLYAWGVLAYELLAGRHPFADRQTVQQLIAAHLSVTPPALETLASGVPPAVSALVMRCLAKEPELRPASASDVIEQLDAAMSAGAVGAITAPSSVSTTTARRSTRLVVGAALALVLGAASWYSARSAGNGDGAPAGRLAVLAFENLGDSADAYFADGMTDAIRGKLTAVGRVEVIARASSRLYAGSTKSPKEIAGELGARYLLTGTVRFAPGPNGSKRVQVSPALVEIGDDGAAKNRWEQPFNADVADVFTVQGEIAAKVADAMRVALDPAGRTRLARAVTRNPDAYDAYLRAEAAWDAGGRTDFTSLQRARPLYIAALALDSGMVEAWGALSRVNGFLYANTLPVDSLRVGAKEAAKRALQLDPQGVDGHRAMGSYYRTVEPDLLKARESLEQARRAAPQDVNVASDLSNIASDLGIFDEALAFSNTARALDPRNARVLQTRSRILLRVARLDEAREAAVAGLALSPTNLQLHQLRVMVELARGDLAAARTAVSAAFRDAPRDRVLAQFGNYWDMGWVLTGDDERDLLALTREAFGGGASSWLTVHATQRAWRGDSAGARAAADSAWPLRAAEVAAVPGDAQRQALLGLMLAHAGRSAEAVKAVQAAMTLVNANPQARASLISSYTVYTAARASLAAGDRALAFALLRDARERHYLANPAWVRLDPSWRSALQDPGFEQALRGDAGLGTDPTRGGGG